MADLVMRWAERIISRLTDADYARLLDVLKAARPFPASKAAERQRRHRAQPGVTCHTPERDMSQGGERDKSVTCHVTSNGHVTRQSHLVSKDSTSLTSCVSAGDSTSFASDSFVQADSKSLNLKTLNAFDRFWAVYPKRVGKGDAASAWKKGACENRADFIIESVQKQMGFLMRDGGQYIPNPATWLNQKRWDDEPPPPSMLSTKTAGNIANLKRFVEEAQRDVR